MKKLVFNDSRQLDVQSVTVAGDGVLHVRMILTSSEALKAVFGDEFATSVMTLYENGKPSDKPYENYTIMKYVKEETGGIWEVEMRQKEADLETQVGELKKESALNASQITDLQMAICEIYEGMVV